MFLSSGDWYVRELLKLPQACQVPFRGSSRTIGFLSRRFSGKGPHLALRGESPGFARVAAGNLGFLCSYDGDLRDPLVLPQERRVSMRIARHPLGCLSSLCRVLGPHLKLKLEPQGSSPVLTWISVFLRSFNRGVRPRLVWRYASPLSSRSVTVVSGFLSS